jgi:hypothetical protein
LIELQLGKHFFVPQYSKGTKKKEPKIYSTVKAGGQNSIGAKKMFKIHFK